MKISPEKNIKKSSIPNIYEYKKSKAKDIILSTALSLGLILSSSMLSSCENKKETTKKTSKLIKYDVEESNYRNVRIRRTNVLFGIPNPNFRSRNYIEVTKVKYISTLKIKSKKKSMKKKARDELREKIRKQKP